MIHTLWFYVDKVEKNYGDCTYDKTISKDKLMVPTHFTYFMGDYVSHKKLKPMQKKYTPPSKIFSA